MLVMRRDIILFMVQDSIVDQRSEDGNNKLRGAVVVEITALMILFLRFM